MACTRLSDCSRAREPIERSQNGRAIYTRDDNACELTYTHSNTRPHVMDICFICTRVGVADVAERVCAHVSVQNCRISAERDAGAVCQGEIRESGERIP